MITQGKLINELIKSVLRLNIMTVASLERGDRDVVNRCVHY